MLMVALMAAWASAGVIETFEGYADGATVNGTNGFGDLYFPGQWPVVTAAAGQGLAGSVGATGTNPDFGGGLSAAIDPADIVGGVYSVNMSVVFGMSNAAGGGGIRLVVGEDYVGTGTSPKTYNYLVFDQSGPVWFATVVDGASTAISVAGTGIDVGDWVEVMMTIDTNNMGSGFTAQWRDLDDGTGDPAGDWNLLGAFTVATANPTTAGAGVFGTTSAATYFDNFGPVDVVPEPSMLTLLGIGVALALVGRGRRRK